MTRTLYQIEGCPFAWRARIALLEKELPFQTVLFDRDRRPAELEAIGPDARSPTLVDDDVPLWESLVILEYLEDRYPERPLLPRDPAERARVRSAVQEIERKLMPAFGALVREAYLRPPDQRDAAAVERARAAWRDAQPPFDRMLAGRRFLVGDQLSLADVVLFTPFPSARRVSGEEVPASLVHLRGWLDRMAARPSTRPAESAAA